MSEAWALVLALLVTTALIRASGPVLLGGRELPPRALGVVALMAPALLAALVITQTFGADNELVLDERLMGVGAAGVLLTFTDSLLLVITVAAMVTAGARAI